jgi:hypothetical protein
VIATGSAPHPRPPNHELSGCSIAGDRRNRSVSRQLGNRHAVHRSGPDATRRIGRGRTGRAEANPPEEDAGRSGRSAG